MKRGFTHSELLVAIALIGILSTFLLISTQGPRREANEVKLAGQLDQVGKAFELYALQEKLQEWPKRSYADPATNPPTLLENIVAGGSIFPGFNQYLSSAPELPYGMQITYDYRTGAQNAVYDCSVDPDIVNGVALRVSHGSLSEAEAIEVYQKLNEIFDGDDGDVLDSYQCGDIRILGNSYSLYYSLGIDRYDTY